MKFRLEFDAQWEPRKVTMVQAEIRRLLAQMRGVSNMNSVNLVLVDEVDGSTSPTMAPKDFYCLNNQFGKKCGATWKSMTFQPCPSCGQRKYVHKGTPEEAEAV